MGLRRFSYPSDKLLLVSSLYPSSEEKVESQSNLELVPNAFPLKNGWGPTHFLREKPWGRGWSQRRENLSLSLFPRCGQCRHLSRARTRLRAMFSDRVVTGDWAETCNAWLIPRPNAQISFFGRLDKNGGFFLIEGYSYRKCHP